MLQTIARHMDLSIKPEQNKNSEVWSPERTSYTLELNLTSNYLLYSSVESIKTAHWVVLGLFIWQPSSFLARIHGNYENLSLLASKAASNETRDGHKIARLNAKVVTWPSHVADNGFSISHLKRDVIGRVRDAAARCCPHYIA